MHHTVICVMSGYKVLLHIISKTAQGSEKELLYMKNAFQFLYK